MRVAMRAHTRRMPKYEQRRQAVKRPTRGRLRRGAGDASDLESATRQTLGGQVQVDYLLCELTVSDVLRCFR